MFISTHINQVFTFKQIKTELFVLFPRIQAKVSKDVKLEQNNTENSAAVIPSPRSLASMWTSPPLLFLNQRPITSVHLLSLVARETEEPSGANGHHFRQASEGGRPRPRSWTLYRYARTHTHARWLVNTHTQPLWGTVAASVITGRSYD